jgi:hypothetical protein
MDTSVNPLNLLNQLETPPSSSTPSPPGASLPSNYGSTISTATNVLGQLQQPGTSQPQAPAHSPNLLERLLPTAGSILGGLASGALDIGTGGAALALDPAIAGLGGAAGKALENAMTGQKVLQGNDVTSGVEGAVGQGIGMGASKLLGEGGNILAKSAENKVASQAEENAGKASVNQAQAFKNNYGVINDKLQNSLNLGKNASLVNQLGYDGTDPYQMQHVSQGGLEINNVVNDALQKSKPIDMSGFNNQIYENMRRDGITDLSTSPLGKAMADAGIVPDGGVPDELSAPQARSLGQSVNLQMRNIANSIEYADRAGNKTVANELQHQYDNLNSVYNDVQDKIFTNNPEVDSAIKNANVSDEDRDALVQNYGEKLGNNVADTINNAQSGKELVSAMRPFAQMNEASKMAINDIENGVATPRAVARAKGTATAEQPGNLLSSKNVLGAGSLLEGTLGHHPAFLGLPLAAKAIQDPAVMAGAGSVLSKIGGSFLPAAAAQVVANSPNDVATANNGSRVTPMDFNNTNSPLSIAIQQSLDMPGLGGLQNLASLVPAAQKVAGAESAYQNYLNELNLAGGAQGPLGGILSRLGETITGGPASLFGSNLGASQGALQSAETNAGLTPGMVPSIMQSQPTAQAASNGAVNNIQSLLGALESPTQ